MKKSLIALAVLAASGAAVAQSSVTLYGILDTYLASEKTETVTRTGLSNASLTQNKVSSGGVNTSRWGMKGTEDLGGGLRANFDLQQGIKLDDGTATNAAKAFSRQAWVGLSGGFGAVRLGYTTTPYYDVDGLQNAMFDASDLAPQYRIFRSTKYTARPSNTIFYQAPNMGGFSGAVSYSLGENKDLPVGNVWDAGYTTSLNLTYAGGPISASFGFQNEKANGKADGVTFVRLGAAYDFGVAVAKITYGRMTDARYIANVVVPKAGNETTEWQVGVDVPISSALMLSASYAKSDENTFAGGNNASGRTGFGAAVKYTLSKRTFVYGGFESDTAEAPGFNDATNTIVAAGVQHRF